MKETFVCGLDNTTRAYLGEQKRYRFRRLGLNTSFTTKFSGRSDSWHLLLNLLKTVDLSWGEIDKFFRQETQRYKCPRLTYPMFPKVPLQVLPTRELLQTQSLSPLTKNNLGQVWCHTPLISVLMRQRRQISERSKPIWSMYQIPELSEMHRETLF